MKVVIFDSALEKFIESLEKKTIARVLRSIDLLAEYGNALEMPHSKHVQKNLFELRIRGYQEIRIFYSFSKSQAILLYGYVKKSQKTPKKELDKALRALKRLT
ncbi:MAG: Uncharacterized protein G01um101470_387, partial [Parcubacteria group bacterium Gr01-1014_70]